ncbi:hypothetical protein GCM10010233_08430 [Streptomyces pseudogriseolus]|uniref:Uncharacterized protein n=1 Tax=Streptomyces pseudogriseolus TaxID=36817 RepID=A0ABQ2T6E1_STREZ|nr:hypothetical protein GCM10010233_08430 [Streptomyces gancidicus]GGS52639.1 hypothetical protein GCM10010285_35150 [Streptomyces rubiginosus]
MADARPGARIVHIVRLDPAPCGTAVAPGGAFAGVTDEVFKHSGDVILTSIAIRRPRATLVASCSLVSLAVQSLRSM